MAKSASVRSVASQNSKSAQATSSKPNLRSSGEMAKSSPKTPPRRATRLQAVKTYSELSESDEDNVVDPPKKSLRKLRSHQKQIAEHDDDDESVDSSQSDDDDKGKPPIKQRSNPTATYSSPRFKLTKAAKKVVAKGRLKDHIDEDESEYDDSVSETESSIDDESTFNEKEKVASESSSSEEMVTLRHRSPRKSNVSEVSSEEDSKKGNRKQKKNPTSPQRSKASANEEEDEEEDEDEIDVDVNDKFQSQQFHSGASKVFIRHTPKIKRRAREINSEAKKQAIQVFRNTAAPSVIVEAARFNPTVRRSRVHWTPEEEESLREGIRKYGEQAWAKILDDPVLGITFHATRTMIDLKDKWRNMVDYKPYSERPIRRYMLVDEYHNPILTDAGNPHYFNNRYPRDAAAKVASKGEFYQPGQHSILIFLREVPLEGGNPFGNSNAGKVVHVYEGTRSRQTAVNIEKFKGIQTMWVPSVTKIREERLVHREEF